MDQCIWFQWLTFFHLLLILLISFVMHCKIYLDVIWEQKLKITPRGKKNNNNHVGRETKMLIYWIPEEMTFIIQYFLSSFFISMISIIEVLISNVPFIESTFLRLTFNHCILKLRVPIIKTQFFTFSMLCWFEFRKRTKIIPSHRIALHGGTLILVMNIRNE